jgi:hypothetical protein
MYHAGDMRPERLTQLVQRQLNGRRRGKIRQENRKRAFLGQTIKSDHAAAVAQGWCERLPELAGGAGNENQRTYIGLVHAPGLLPN